MQTIPQLFDSERPVYLIGGGASLAGFDFERMNGKQVVAINTAFRKVPTADVLFFGDMMFYQQYRDPQGADFWRFRGGKIVTSCQELAGKNDRIEVVDAREGDFSRDEKYIGGLDKNSGWQAINLAFLMGAKTIVLLGYDSTPGHWHDETSLAHRGTVSPQVYPKYTADMVALAKLIKAKKVPVRIINANPNSAIDAFEKMDINAALTL